MEIIINRNKIYGDEKEVLTINERGVYYETDGLYPVLVTDDKFIIDMLYTKFFSLTYTWKQEYIGPRSIDGSKFIVSMDVNHKRKTYKIQNKYPENWQEFIDFANEVASGKILNSPFDF